MGSTFCAGTGPMGINRALAGPYSSDAATVGAALRYILLFILERTDNVGTYCVTDRVE